MPVTKTKKPVEAEAVNVTIVKAAPSTAVGSNALAVEDEFKNMYGGVGDGKHILEPPYTPTRLQRLVQENNALGQCIEAMEVNIDGTGYNVAEDADKDTAVLSDKEVERLSDFFKEPYPSCSFISMRRAVRVDMETIGFAFLEVIRNPLGEIIFTRHLDGAHLRLIQLEEPVYVKKTITRAGKAETVTMAVRERAFVQKIGNQVVYFREYGTSRDINKVTGAWSGAGQKLPAPERGTELIYFKAKNDSGSPYGVPRWINQLPSILGSRKAEELNLDYFDAGGVPPAAVFVNGGIFTTPSKKALENVFAGKAKEKLRVAVCEVQSTSGDINSNSSATVNVVKFGQEMVSDSMFEEYDSKCERRVRSSFRLPPMFVGKAEDYSYATAFASYSVAEAQVFKPERDEFDQIINSTLMVGLGAEGYKMTSDTLAIHDAVIQLKAVDMAGDAVTEEEKIRVLNNISSLTLEYDEEGQEARNNRKDVVANAAANAATVPVNAEGAVQDGGAAQGEGETTPTKPAKVKKVDTFEIAGLANDIAVILDLVEGERQDETFNSAAYERLESLGKADRDMFDALFAARTLESARGHDQDVSRLAHAATTMMGN